MPTIRSILCEFLIIDIARDSQQLWAFMILNRRAVNRKHQIVRSLQLHGSSGTSELIVHFWPSPIQLHMTSFKQLFHETSNPIQIVLGASRRLDFKIALVVSNMKCTMLIIQGMRAGRWESHELEARTPRRI